MYVCGSFTLNVPRVCPFYMLGKFLNFLTQILLMNNTVMIELHIHTYIGSWWDH